MVKQSSSEGPAAVKWKQREVFIGVSRNCKRKSEPKAVLPSGDEMHEFEQTGGCNVWVRQHASEEPERVGG